MTQFQTFHHTDFGFRLQCVCVNGDAWFNADDVAAILGFTNTAEAISCFDDDDAKTLSELVPNLTVDCVVDPRTRRDNSISVYGAFDLVQKSQHQDAYDFRRWLWSDIIKGIRKMAHPHLEGCYNNEEEQEEEGEEEEEEEEEDEESLCARLIKYIHKAYPDAFAFVGRNESQHVDGILKGGNLASW